MGTLNCPYCNEDIKAEALICKHCHSRIKVTLKELVTARIIERLKAPAIALPAVSPCGALCYSKFANNNASLTDCLNDCECAEAIAVVAERMQRELFGSFMEGIWGRGNIDPVPLEKFVRDRFSKIKMNVTNR